MDCKIEHIEALLKDEYKRLLIRSILVDADIELEGAFGKLADTNVINVVLAILGVPEDNWDSMKCMDCEHYGNCDHPKCGMRCWDCFYHYTSAPTEIESADEFVKGFLDMVDQFKGVDNETM